MSAPAAVEHGHHGPIVWPKDEQYGEATPAKIGMWIFLLSDALSFAGLLLGYGILRGGHAVWRHEDEPLLGINFTALLTFLLICSSVTMVLAYAASAEGDRKKATFWLSLTALGGALFLCGQYQEYFGIVGHGLTKEGLIFGHSAYASTFYVVTSFHGFHVFSGVVYILITMFRNMSGKATTSQIELLGLFWHFVDLVWILVFTLIYLIPLEHYAAAAVH
jgi:heme/copper-type cytochrome/quinol oxidase subunit 3